MKILALVFFALILALQYPIWLGKGGWLQVHALNRELEAQRAANALLKARNDALEAEVVNLKSGLDAVEERARAELGMVKKDEIFFQFHKQSATATPLPPSPAPATAVAAR